MTTQKGDECIDVKHEKYHCESMDAFQHERVKHAFLYLALLLSQVIMRVVQTCFLFLKVLGSK